MRRCRPLTWGRNFERPPRRKSRRAPACARRRPRPPRTVARSAGCVVRSRGRRNGAGKTTTIRAVLGLVGRRGRIAFAGDDIQSLPTHKIVQRAIGYVPEDRDVFAGLSVEENLKLAERSADPRYGLVYDLFPELRERAKQRAGTLSSGSPSSPPCCSSSRTSAWCGDSLATSSSWARGASSTKALPPHS